MQYGLENGNNYMGGKNILQDILKLSAVLLTQQYEGGESMPL